VHSIENSGKFFWWNVQDTGLFVKAVEEKEEEREENKVNVCVYESMK